MSDSSNRMSMDSNLMPRRKYLQLAGLTGIASLAGCASSGGGGGGGGATDTSTPTPTPTPTESGGGSITAWAWNDKALAPLRKKQKKMFKEEMGKSLKWQYFPFEQYLTKLQSSIAANKAPDAFALATVWIPKLASKGAVANLSKQSGIDVPELIQAGRRNSAYQGGLYSVPWYADCRCLAINKDKFKEAGLEIPSDPTKEPTWDQFAKWVNTLSNDNQAGIVMPAGGGFEAFMLSNGGHYIEELDGGGYRAAIADKEVVNTAKYFVEEVGVDNWSRVDDDLEVFISGNAAMSLGGSWELGQLDKADIDYMYMPWPVGPSGDSSHSWSAGVYYSAPPNPSQGALDFLEFILSEEQQIKALQEVGGFPGRASVYESDKFKNIIQGDPVMEVVAQEMQKAVPLPRITSAIQLLTEIARPALQSIWQGKSSPQEALDKAADQMVSELDSVKKR